MFSPFPSPCIHLKIKVPFSRYSDAENKTCWVILKNKSHRSPLSQKSSLQPVRPTTAQLPHLLQLWYALTRWISLPLVTDTSFTLYLRDLSQHQTAAQNIYLFFSFNFWWELKSTASKAHQKSLHVDVAEICCPHLPSLLMLLLSLTQFNMQKGE